MACLLIFFTPLGISKSSAAPSKKKVLVLSPYQVDLPNHDLAMHALQEEFDNAKDFDLDVYYEYLELIRFPDPVTQQQILDLLAVKYRNQHIDLVMINDRVLLDLWLEKRSMILPDTPVVLFSTSTASIEGLQFPPDVTGVTGKVDYTQSIKWILSVRPSVNEIVLVYGNGREETPWIQPANILRKEAGKQVQLTDLSGLSLDEIKQRVASLQANAIVLYELMFKDGTGDEYRPIDILKELTSVSPVPVISGDDFCIGTGTIGGYMFSTDQQARDAAQIGLRILRGEAPSSIPVQKDRSNRFIFDHLALQRFNIPLSDLPPDSIIKNRQYTFWELYQTEIIITIIIISSLLTLVIFLLRLTSKLYHTRLTLADLNINLEAQIQERTVDLQKANTKLELLSNVDCLTNLYNRRYFDAALKSEWKRHKRTQSPLSLIMCDIDFFKQYNDTYGHLAGDDCITRVAKAIGGKAKRPSDSAVRYGGEEFALILSETDLKGATTVAKNIKQTIENLEIEHTTSLVKPIISLSFGVATVIPNSNQEPEILISLADNALYQSKEKGRDQIQQINLVK